MTTLNINPIFSDIPRLSWGDAMTAGNTAMDGTGTTYLIFTAGAKGSLLSEAVFRPTGAAVPTVVRLFLNNGSTPATPANNMPYGELTLPQITVTQTAQQEDFRIPIGKAIEPNHRVYASLGTGVANGWKCAIDGGDY
jgi:hypothetical protein